MVVVVFVVSGFGFEEKVLVARLFCDSCKLRDRCGLLVGFVFLGEFL